MKKITLYFTAIVALFSCSSDHNPELGTEPVYEYYDAAQTQIKSIANYKPGDEKRKGSYTGLQMLETYKRNELMATLASSGLDSVAYHLTPSPLTDYNGYETAVLYSFTAENKTKFDAYLSKNPDVLKGFPSDMKLMWSAKAEENSFMGKKQLIYNLYAARNSSQNITNADIKVANVGLTEDDIFTVNLSMTPEGAEKWEIMTSDNVNRNIAITAGNVVFSAPLVRSAIAGGNTEISGNFTRQEAEKLCAQINRSVLDGECRLYHRNGNLKEVFRYENGERVGEWSTYDENGKLIKTRGKKKD